LLDVPSLELMTPEYTNTGDDGMMASIQQWPNCDLRVDIGISAREQRNDEPCLLDAKDILLVSCHRRSIHMPNFRKLDPAEVQAYQNKGKGERKLIAELFDSILADYEIGEYGEAVLDEGENRLTVRNRMKAAATRRGIDINFRRMTGDLLRFQIVEHTNGAPKASRKAAAPPPPPPEPVKRKSGRPKKSS
jgi:hypothetical protein